MGTCQIWLVKQNDSAAGFLIEQGAGRAQGKKIQNTFDLSFQSVPRVRISVCLIKTLQARQIYSFQLVQKVDEDRLAEIRIIPVSHRLMLTGHHTPAQQQDSCREKRLLREQQRQ